MFCIRRIVPNYELAPNLEQIEILRVVVRESMTEVVRFLLISVELSGSHRTDTSLLINLLLIWYV
jgi:hypothetical protein